MATNNSWNSSTIVGVAQGGTNVATLTTNAVLLGQSTSSVTTTGTGTAGQIMVAKGASADSGWITSTATTPLVATHTASTINYDFSTTVTVAKSGTGATSFTAYSPVLGNLSTSTNPLGSVLQAGPLNGALTSTGLGTVSWQSASIIKLSTQTVSSAVSTLDFTSGISSTYAHYLLTYTGVVSSAGGVTLRAIVGTAGPVYVNGGYYSLNLNFPYNSTTVTTGTTASNFILSPNASFISTTGFTTGYAYLMNLSGGSGSTTFMSEAYAQNTTGTSTYSFGNIAANTYVALRIFYGTGNITAGTFTLYGIIS